MKSHIKSCGMLNCGMLGDRILVLSACIVSRIYSFKWYVRKPKLPAGREDYQLMK